MLQLITTLQPNSIERGEIGCGTWLINFCQCLGMKKNSEKAHKKAGSCPCFTRFQKQLADFWAFRIPIRLWEMGMSPSSHEVSDSGFGVFNPTRGFEVEKKSENKGHI